MIWGTCKDWLGGRRAVVKTHHRSLSAQNKQVDNPLGAILTARKCWDSICNARHDGGGGANWLFFSGVSLSLGILAHYELCSSYMHIQLFLWISGRTFVRICYPETCTLKCSGSRSYVLMHIHMNWCVGIDSTTCEKDFSPQYLGCSFPLPWQVDKGMPECKTWQAVTTL